MFVGFCEENSWGSVKVAFGGEYAFGKVRKKCGC